MKDNISSKIEDAGVIAVLVIDELKHAIPLAHALIKGGIDMIELTLRTPVAMEAAQLIQKEVPEITLGFGTVLSIEQINAVADLGAEFAVAPGCNPKVIEEANKRELYFAPGIMTPSDIEIAVEHGCKMLKYFPAESSGGMAHLKNISGPYQYLGLKFIPLGGLNTGNVETYIGSPLVAAIGGSWIAKRDLILSEAWSTITHNAREVKTLIKQIRNN